MKKIALIGVENDHAPTFLNIMKNKPEKYKDIQVVGVYSYDGKAAKQLVDSGLAPYMATSPDEFVGKVDGVINTARHGDNHYCYSMPYILEGVPMFIDKPFTISLQNAKDMIETAKSKNALLCGGSTLKFAPELLSTKERIIKGEFGNIISASLSAPVQMQNFHGNFFFYSAHLAQMVITLFGLPNSVNAYEKANSVTVVCHYSDKDVTMHYVSYYYSVTVFGTSSSFHTPLTVNTDVFEKELEEFCNMLRTGIQPHPYSELTETVSLLDAIYLSFRTNTEQKINRIVSD